ncbi:MAG: glycosyltransferase family 1 protein [Pirellulales bacterium]
MSHTLDSGLGSGIQRVVRSLAANMPDAAAAQKVESRTVVNSVVIRDGVFQTADSQNGWVTETYRKTRARFAARLPNWYRVWLNRIGVSRWPKPLRGMLLPSDGKLGIFFLPIAVRHVVLRAARALTLSRRRVRFQPGDVLLLPDGYWVMKRVWPAVAAARSQGVRVASLVYDLITVEHPGFFTQDSLDKFRRYLEEVDQHADLVLTISHTVALDYQKWRACRPESERGAAPVHVIPLGADFSDRQSPLRPQLQDLVDRQIPIFVVVSTIEPRKNHPLVLRAFEQLWSDTNIALVFVGRCGWMFDSVLEQFQKHPENGHRFWHISDADDGELNSLLQACAGVICPSHAEGFGLPIAEGLHHGKPVFASDIAIHREVGGAYCFYFDKTDPSSLTKLIRAHVSQDKESCSQISTTSSSMTWKHAAEVVLKELQTPSEATESRSKQH